MCNSENVRVVLVFTSRLVFNHTSFLLLLEHAQFCVCLDCKSPLHVCQSSKLRVDYESTLQERAQFYLWSVCDSPLEDVQFFFYQTFLTTSFRILFSLLPLRNPSRSFGLFSASAISPNYASFQSSDDIFGIVYFDQQHPMIIDQTQQKEQ